MTDLLIKRMANKVPSRVYEPVKKTPLEIELDLRKEEETALALAKKKKGLKVHIMTTGKNAVLYPKRFRSFPSRMFLTSVGSIIIGGNVAAGAIARNTFFLNSLDITNGFNGSVGNALLAYKMYNRYKIHGVQLKVDVIAKAATPAHCLVEPSVNQPAYSTVADLIANGGLPSAWLGSVGVTTGQAVTRFHERYWDFSTLFGIKDLATDEDYAGDTNNGGSPAAPALILYITFGSAPISSTFLINTDPIFQVTCSSAIEFYEPIDY